MASGPSGGPGQTAGRPPPRLTAASLQRAALAYLERYASSRENLRRVLRRRIDRRCRLRGEDPEPFHPLVEEVLERCARAGLLDDARYAEAGIASLRRRGGSIRTIRARLASRGVDRETIAAALAAEDVDEQATEEAAAHALARRRRLGPYRAGGRERWREKDIAALARAGFSFDLARRVIGGERLEE
jgi:regulatory protein